MAEEFKNLLEYYGFTKEDEKKYPVISRILKSLTPGRIKKEIEAIQKVKLPAELERWVKEYEKVGKRSRFFWKWLYQANQVIVFPGVPRQYKKSLRLIKTLFNVFVTLLDDVADEGSDKRLLGELLKAPFEPSCINYSRLGKQKRKYLNFTYRLFRYIGLYIREYPRYKEFKDIFEYDVRQLLNAMRYAYLVNANPYIVNETECWAYCSHNMQAMIDLTLDLLCAPRFPLDKLGVFRQIAWEAQRMARVGNWVSTWARELQQNDFTSGVIAYMIGRDASSIDASLVEDKRGIAKRVRRLHVEKHFLQEWEQSYRRIVDLTKKISLKGMKSFLWELEELLFMHLESRGYK